MDIKNTTAPCMSAQHDIHDKLQGSVATYLRCGGVVNNQIKKDLFLSYKQERDCLVHFLRLLAACWSGVQSARDNHVLACNFGKYSPI